MEEPPQRVGTSLPFKGLYHPHVCPSAWHLILCDITDTTHSRSDVISFPAKDMTYCTLPVADMTSLFRRESHYGENDGDGDGDVHGLKRHREQSVTPYNSNTKRKWRTSYFVDLPSLHFTASRRFPERRNHRRSRIHSELPSQSAQEPCSTVEVVISANMAVIFLSASESHFAFDLLAAAAIAHFFVR